MDKIRGMISLCKKAGRLAEGYDMAMDAAGKDKAFLILTTTDLSSKTDKELTFRLNKNTIPRRQIPYTMDEIGMVLSKRVGVLAVCDKGFAAKLMELIDCTQGKEQMNAD